jgi:hypothetical protein
VVISQRAMPQRITVKAGCGCGTAIAGNCASQAGARILSLRFRCTHSACANSASRHNATRPRASRYFGCEDHSRMLLTHLDYGHCLASIAKFGELLLTTQKR